MSHDQARPVIESTPGEGDGAGLTKRQGPPIDGAELLADTERFAGRFLAFQTKHHLVVLSLWAAHTWAVGAFYVTPRLVINSPEPGSGKTRVLEILALLCHDARLTVNTSPAALYRRIRAAEGKPPTILQDECDAVFGGSTNVQAEDLRALFNAGYKVGATVDRCEGQPRNMEVVDFPVFAPAALAGLIKGSVAKRMRTVLDRAVTFHMRRREPDEHVDEFRGRDAEADAAPLRERLRAWVIDHFDTLAAARPGMPEGIRDRRAECWEALLAVADAAGGDWPHRAREACRHFEFGASPDDERLSEGVRLLRDIKSIFEGRDRMHSAAIIDALTSDPESEWAADGKPLEPRHLAQELKQYGVQSGDVRIGELVRKGYRVGGDTGLGQAWRRYLSPRDRGDQRDTAGPGVAECSTQGCESNKRNADATAEFRSDQGLFENVADVADVAVASDNDEDPALGPRQRDNGASCAPVEETTEVWFTGPGHTLPTDLDARQYQANSNDRPQEPGNGHGERNGLCPQCEAPLGSKTGKCLQCILKRAAAQPA